MGILYCKAGQSSEEEMYNNEEAGPAFEEFLSLIGEKVCLKGFTKYAAQLDVKSKWGRGPGCITGSCHPMDGSKLKGLQGGHWSAGTPAVCCKLENRGSTF